MALTAKHLSARSVPVHRRPGLSLAEAAVSVVLVSGLVVVALNTLGSAVRARQIEAESSFAAVLAQQLMTEVLQAAYEEPEWAEQTIQTKSGKVNIKLTENPVTTVFGCETGEADGTRTYFDDVDDYDGWSASPPQDKEGADLENYDGWTREVTVDYATPANPAAKAPSDLGLKLITVIVTDPHGEQTSLVALRCNKGVYSQTPTDQTTYVHWIGLNLQIGDDSSTAVEAGVNFLNQPINTDQ